MNEIDKKKPKTPMEALDQLEESMLADHGLVWIRGILRSHFKICKKQIRKLQDQSMDNVRMDQIHKEIEIWKQHHNGKPPDSILIKQSDYLLLCKELGIEPAPPHFKEKTGLTATTINKFSFFNKPKK